MCICQGWCGNNSFTREVVGLMFLPNLISNFVRVKMKILSLKVIWYLWNISSIFAIVNIKAIDCTQKNIRLQTCKLLEETINIKRKNR